MPEESTTPDLVERWRQTTEAVNRRDFDGAIRFLAPEAVWDASVAAMFGRFEGSAAVRGFLEDWSGSFEQYEYTEEEVLDLGNGVLFAVARIGGRLAGGAGTMQERWAFTVTWAAGMIVEVTTHTDIDEARAAAERLAKERG